MAKPPEKSPTAGAPPNDLGFGSRVAREAGARFLERDGSFNVVREGVPLWRQLNPYHALTSISWPRFYALVLGLFLATNLLFAGLFFLCGPGALEGASVGTSGARFLDCFFFSIQTLATIGYGRISPVGLGANVLVAVEALVGLLGFSLATGLTFARFSLPSAKVRFSRRATIAPYRGGRALMFRIVNERTSQLVEVGATVTLAWRPRDGATSTRRFLPLPLERNSVVFFPMHWVVVHPIDEASPLAGVDAEGLREMDAELLILVTGTDEASSQTVQVRSSYKADEIVVGGRFADLFLPARSDGRIGVDLARFDELEPAELPPADRVPMKEV